ncbi:hypothetical protein K469DRAFT_721761 [Zopfia rhizophila CBS 207.26]|uniref:Uncharacterized protein n=1 Tax=Zopfia rhizophila CBS 207.26 TaxID=1314779 RepID=A0A6A6EHB0_9PEZI|nr:hypothetical protein K469DRAFT_721761 [Zopfia rhizophila CBS 207.26]
MAQSPPLLGFASPTVVSSSIVMWKPVSNGLPNRLDHAGSDRRKWPPPIGRDLLEKVKPWSLERVPNYGREPKRLLQYMRWRTSFPGAHTWPVFFYILMLRAGERELVKGSVTFGYMSWRASRAGSFDGA